MPGRGRFIRDPGSGALIHRPTRRPEDLRGGGAASGGGGGGPAILNGQNVNARGIGVFDGKVGTDLTFRGVDDPSNRIGVSLDTTDHVIDLDIDEDALTTLAHLLQDNTFTGTNTFQGPTVFEDYIELEEITTPATPSTGRHRIFARQNGSDLELVALDWLGNECILCTHSIPGVTNTLPIMWVEV